MEGEEEDQYGVLIKTVQANIFKILIDALNHAESNMPWEFDKNGISSRTVICDNQIFVTMKLHNFNFYKWGFKEPFILHLDLKTLNNLTKAYGQDDQLAIEIPNEDGEPANFLRLQCHTTSKNMMTIDSPRVNDESCSTQMIANTPNPGKYTLRVTITSKVLQQVINRMKDREIQNITIKVIREDGLPYLIFTGESGSTAIQPAEPPVVKIGQSHAVSVDGKGKGLIGMEKVTLFTADKVECRNLEPEDPIFSKEKDKLMTGPKTLFSNVLKLQKAIALAEAVHIYMGEKLITFSFMVGSLGYLQYTLASEYVDTDDTRVVTKSQRTSTTRKGKEIARDQKVNMQSKKDDELDFLDELESSMHISQDETDALLADLEASSSEDSDDEELERYKRTRKRRRLTKNK